MTSLFKSKNRSNQLGISVLPVDYDKIICKNGVFKVLKITSQKKDDKIMLPLATAVAEVQCDFCYLEASRLSCT